MSSDKPNILIINPWIHDFAAYDVWAKPLGLLILSSILRDHGFSISYMDCLDRFHSKAPKTDPYARNGRGPYIKTRIQKPRGLEDVPRYFSRYGIKKKWFIEDLLNEKKPDLVLMTTMMTYWYPGTKETIDSVRAVFPDVPIILGGIYANLCEDHAKASTGADLVVTGPGEKSVLEIASEFTGFAHSPKIDFSNPDTYPYPAFDLQQKITYVPILTSKGCPFSCAYCASSFLNSEFTRRSPDHVIDEITYWHKKYNVADFIIYDDAFLVDSEKHAALILEGIVRKEMDIRFHTPNAVHIREVSKNIAKLLKMAGFITLRLGLETASFVKRERLDHKVTYHEFQMAASHLKNAGFRKEDMGAYILAGLPNQEKESVLASLEAVNSCGIKPIIAHYTPIPNTAMWKEACASSRYDLQSDPVFTNNALLPCRKEEFSWEMISPFKELTA